MATNMRFTEALRNAGLDAMLGAAQNGGKVRIYSGTQPAGPATAITDQVLLAEVTLNATAWAAASGGSKAANAITGAAAVASGTATWFRITDSAGTTAYVDGSVGTSDANMIVATVTLSAGITVNVSSLTITIPTSA